MNQPPLLAQDLFASIPLSEVAKGELRRRMADPSRHYHTLHHLDLLWSRHLQWRDMSVLADRRLDALIALSIAFHDAVYAANASDNERRSAELWLDISATATTLDPDARLWVADTIRATADHVGSARHIDTTGPLGYARQWVLDLDLTPLGETADVFDENMTLLAREAVHRTTAQHRDDLQKALRHFASARPLYRCRPIARAFAAPARRNFERHLQRQERGAA